MELFHRSKTVVTLTEEGEALLPTAHEVLEKERNFYRQAQTMSTRGAGVLKIGYFDYWEYPFLCRVVSLFSKRNPYTTLTFGRDHHGPLNRDIQLGNYDIVFTLDKKKRQEKEPPNIGWLPIAESPLYVYVSASSYLADKKVLTLQELCKDNQIIVSRQYESIFNSIVSAAFAEEGLEASYYPISPKNSKDMMLMVLANEGYNLSTHWWTLADIPGIRIIPLKANISTIEFGVAYRKSARRDLIDSFLECVREVPTEEFLQQNIKL